MPSVQEDEEQATNTAWPNLQAHVNYLSDVYTFAFSMQRAIDGKRIADIPDVVRAQFMILMRITDYLRGIQLLALKCYPEQAGTLAASIFELTHTAVLFSRSPPEAAQWLEASSIKQQVPRKLFGTNWKDMVKANCEHYGAADRTGSEYQVYEQLCWMKHSLPKMQDMLVGDGSVRLIFGPHTDERALSHAWFAMEHAGRLTEFVAALLLETLGNDETRATLQALALRNTELRNLAIARFGQESPFDEPKEPDLKGSQSA